MRKEQRNFFLKFQNNYKLTFNVGVTISLKNNVAKKLTMVVLGINKNDFQPTEKTSNFSSL